MIDGFSLLLMGLVAVGCLVGAYVNGLNYYFLVHLFSAVFALILYMAGRELIHMSASQMRVEIRRLAFIVTAVHIPVMALYVFWLSSGQVYFGMSASILILCAVFFIDERRWNWAAIAVVMILVSGKRGELIGLVFAIMAWSAARGVSLGFGSFVKYFLGLAILLFLMLVASVTGFGSEILGSLSDKFASLLKTDFGNLSSYETRAAIGGRGVELMIIQEKFQSVGWERILAGLGYGWNVVVSTVGGSEVDVLYFVHVSPINSIVQYGLLGALVFWTAMVFTIGRGLTLAKLQPANRVLVPYLIGMIFVSLSAYVISVDPSFWICLGASSSLIHNRFMKSKARKITRRKVAPGDALIKTSYR